ncbi:MAG: recombinase family protein [Clostridium sp.]|nr:recombinase family protein [Clostridium sp.]
MNKNYGYIRVSTKEQNESRQLLAMHEAGIEKEMIYIDKQSGKDFLRPQYKRMIRRLRSGDAVFILSIDRLGRNYEEIIEQWKIITSEKQADIVVLDMPLLDTRQRDKDLTGVFISNLVLQILSYVAQTERENIRKRQAEGIAAAKLRGVKLGRESIPKPEGFDEIAAQWKKRGCTSTEVAESLGISRSLLYKWLREYGTFD